MKVQCPHCPQRYELLEVHFGKMLTCQSCGKEFLIMHLNTDRQGYEYTPPPETGSVVEPPEAASAVAPNADTQGTSEKEQMDNSVAQSLNSIGDTIFFLTVALCAIGALIGCFVILILTGQGESPLPVVIALVISAVVIIIPAYITKTLYNGFAELIQISHDMRQEIKDMRQDMQRK